MRKAFQRCASSIPRSLPVLVNPTRNAIQCLRSLRELPAVLPARQAGARRLHQLSRLRQGTAAQQANAGPDADGNGADVITRFEELEQRGLVHPNVVQTLTKDMGLETMTEVQSRTINESVKGTDVIAQAKTGTGKTLAFLIPILQRIIQEDPNLARTSYSRRGPRTTADDIRAIIISPTRELAEQIAEEAKKITRNTSVIVQTAVGGSHKASGLRAIQQNGCHILVGTPGRLKDVLSDPYTRVEAPDLDALVFDEADRLLDQGFWPEIQEIMRLLPTPAEKDRQTMMFSATIPPDVVDLVRSSLKPGFQFVQCVKDNEEPTHEKVKQNLVRLNGLENALPTLIEICTRGLEAAKEPGARPFKAIVYFSSTVEVSLAFQALRALEAPSENNEPSRNAFDRGSRGRNALAPARILEIHSKLTQAQRTYSSDNFRRAESGILLSSDVTSRGMDFPNVTHVIQVGLPSTREQYIHRIGRTARAGREGEGWIILHDIELSEARSRLSGLPLQRDETLDIPGLDLTKAADVPVQASKILSSYQAAMQKVPTSDKSRVYLAHLGVFTWFHRKERLIECMNNLARFGWGMAQPPKVPPGLAYRLKLTRVAGVNIGHPETDEMDGPMGGRDGRSPGGYGGGRYSGGRNDAFGRRDDPFGGRDDRFGGRNGRPGGRNDPFGGRDDPFGDRRGSSRDRGFERRGGGRGGPFGGPPANDPFA